MEEKPKPVEEPVLPALTLSLIGVISGSSALFALALFGYTWLSRADLRLAQTFAYATFAVNSMVYIFAYRSLRRSILHSGRLTRNPALIASVALGLGMAIAAVALPWLRGLLRLAPLSLLQWLPVFAIAFSLLLIIELAKYLNARRHGAAQGPGAYR